MSAFKCRGCGVIVSSNGHPGDCPACGGPPSRRPSWYRLESADELFD